MEANLAKINYKTPSPLYFLITFFTLTKGGKDKDILIGFFYFNRKKGFLILIEKKGFLF